MTANGMWKREKMTFRFLVGGCEGVHSPQGKLMKEAEGSQRDFEKKMIQV